MATFTVRVELHDDPTGEDYDTLHEAMKAAGFSRTIKDKLGDKYRLPSAEYDYQGTLDLKGVLAKAKKAALRTKKEHSILVTESKGRTFFGLKRVRPN